MNKEYVLETIEARLKELRKRYNAACNLKTEFGETLSSGSAAYYRTTYTQQINMCILIKELLKGVTELSDEANEGLYRLIEPVERHRRMKC